MRTDILLIEDSHEDADLAIRVLKQDNPGTRIKVVYDGAEAIRYLFDEFDNACSHHFPRVIFLDVKLPRISGPQVLKKLKSYDTTKTIPVVIMTSSNQEQDIVECYALGWLKYNMAVPI